MAEFTLRELAEATGEKERTVRYYQQLGLLRQPGQIGAGAHYHEDDRLRLQLIRQLQAEGRSLSEISAHFAMLDETSLREEALRHGSALDYVRSVLGEPLLRETGGSANYSAPQPETAQWERIEIAPGIELHIKHPITPARRRVIAAYVARARSEIEEGS
jgi:DNA-binding transcriptional MerR regulator